MDKRKFLKTLAASSAATFLAPSLLTSCKAKATEDFKMWIWVGNGTHKTEADWKEQFARLVAVQKP